MFVLKTDYRYGGKTRYYVAEENEILTQVAYFVRKCVMFVGCKMGNKENDIPWYGTYEFWLIKRLKK